MTSKNSAAAHAAYKEIEKTVDRYGPRTRYTSDEHAVILDEVDSARREIVAARERWSKVVMTAHLAGVHNTRIAGRAGVSETAIRQQINRQKKVR